MADVWRERATSTTYECSWRTHADADEFDADRALLHADAAEPDDTLVLALSLGWRMHAYMSALELTPERERTAYMCETLGVARTTRAHTNAANTTLACALFGFTDVRDAYACMALAMLGFESPLSTERTLTATGWALVRGRLATTYTNLLPLVADEQARLEAEYLATHAEHTHCNE